MKVLGLTGCSGAGKDTVANIITGYAPLNACSYAMAEPLRYMLDALLNVYCEPFWTAWTDQNWKNSLIPKLGVTPRYLMQTLGTEWGRDLISKNIWVRIAEDNIDSFLEYCSLVVVSDIRFANEFDMIKKMGGEVWEIRRPGCAPPNDHFADSGSVFHLADRVIHNDGTLEDLARKVIPTICSKVGDLSDFEHHIQQRFGGN